MIEIADCAPVLPMPASSASRPIAGAALAVYLDATHRWITSLCRTALELARGAAARDLGAEHAPAPGLTLDAAIRLSLARNAAAARALAHARAEEREAAEVFSMWGRRGAPHVELALELGLSPMATTVLLLAAAPRIWGGIARAYALCTADPARPLVDELLLAHLLEADACTRAAIGRELDDDAPLVRTGAVAIGRGLRPYASVTVHPAIVRRLVGAPPRAIRSRRARRAHGAPDRLRRRR